MPQLPANNEAVVGRLIEVWASVAEACRGLTKGQWQRETDCPGWTVKDQLAHLISVEKMLLGDPTPELLSDRPPHVKNSIGEINEAWVDALRSAPGPDVFAEFIETTNRRIDALRMFPPEKFDEIGWSPEGDVPYRRFMDTRVMDTWAHEQDIRRAAERPGGRNGAGEKIAMERCGSALPYVVGKKVSPPDGTCVLFIITGLMGRHFPIVIEAGRATLAESTPADVAVTLTMAQEPFWKLCFGRVDYMRVVASGEVTVGGDIALGHRVLEAMPFMV